MVLPVVSLPPVMDRSVETGRSLLDKPCEFRHFQHNLTRLAVLEGPSMVNIFACSPDIADKTNLTCLRLHHEAMSPYIYGVFSCGHAPDPWRRYQRSGKGVMPCA